MIFLSPSDYFDKLKKHSSVINYLYTHREMGAIPISTMQEDLTLSQDDFEEAIKVLSNYDIIDIIENTAYLNDSLQRHLEEVLGASVRLNGSYKNLLDELKEEIHDFNSYLESREQHYRKIVSIVRRVPKDIEVKLNQMTNQKQAIMDITNTKEKLDKINKHYQYLTGVIHFIKEFIDFFDSDEWQENIMTYSHEQAPTLHAIVVYTKSFLSDTAYRHIQHDIKDVIEFINNIRLDVEYHRKINRIYTLIKNGTLDSASNIDDIIEESNLGFSRYNITRKLDYDPQTEDGILGQLLYDVVGLIEIDGENEWKEYNRKKNSLKNWKDLEPIKEQTIEIAELWEVFREQKERTLYEFVFNMKHKDFEISSAERFYYGCALYAQYHNELDILPGQWWSTDIWSDLKQINVPYNFPKIVLKQKAL